MSAKKAKLAKKAPRRELAYPLISLNSLISHLSPDLISLNSLISQVRGG